METRKRLFLLFEGVCGVALVLISFLLQGCSEGKEAPDPISQASGLSPTLSNLVVTGNKISIKNGGILKLSCKWTSAEKISSATAYLAFVQELTNSPLGPQGVISSGTGQTSATVVLKIIFPDYSGGIPREQASFSDFRPYSPSKNFSSREFLNCCASMAGPRHPEDDFLGNGEKIWGQISTTTVSANASGASSATYSQVIFNESFANPLAIPTGIATTELVGYWTVEIPVPASVIGGSASSKQQMLFWMVLNSKKTNTLAFEIELSE